MTKTSPGLHEGSAVWIRSRFLWMWTPWRQASWLQTLKTCRGLYRKLQAIPEAQRACYINEHYLRGIRFTQEELDHD